MFFYKDQTCPVCNKAFQEGEDIVSCPICGAPHHRECWKSEGHCHFESTHGTKEQWTKQESSTQYTKKCPQCGLENVNTNTTCSQCGFPLAFQEPASPDASNPQPNETPDYREFAPFRVIRQDQFYGIPKETKIEGYEIEDIAAVVGQNKAYYLPTFKKLTETKKTAKWNWASFLLTPYWLLFRKNYIFASIVFFFEVLQTALLTYIERVKLSYLFMGSDTSMESIYNGFQTILETNSPHAKYIYLIAILSVISLAIRFLFGFFGNYLYMHNCFDKIQRQKDLYPDNYKSKLHQVGGISLTLACFGYLFCYLVPTLSEMILQLF